MFAPPTAIYTHGPSLRVRGGILVRDVNVRYLPFDHSLSYNVLWVLSNYVVFNVSCFHFVG